jgi:L-threonylcarbamoyladenylate synthase
MSVKPAGEAVIAEGARLLREGRLVAFPTETVYGLGADATNGRAVAGIYAAKGRPRFNPLIAHVASVEAAREIGDLTSIAMRLAEAFWPGPLTLVLERSAGCGLSELVTAGLDTVAVRVPDHPVARSLLAAAAIPIAAPSANKSGHVSPTLASHVADDLGDDVALVIDGGATAHGLESTIVDARGETAVMLRPGAVTAAAIEAVLGAGIRRSFDAGDQPIVPGQLESHYAPRARVRLQATVVAPGEALLAFGPGVPPSVGMAMINLSPTGDLVEAAASLFTALRRLDASGAQCIAVMPIPDTGLGEAINDRLRRAAAPRSG